MLIYLFCFALVVSCLQASSVNKHVLYMPEDLYTVTLHNTVSLVSYHEQNH